MDIKTTIERLKDYKKDKEEKQNDFSLRIGLQR